SQRLHWVARQGRTPARPGGPGAGSASVARPARLIPGWRDGQTEHNDLQRRRRLRGGAGGNDLAPGRTRVAGGGGGTGVEDCPTPWRRRYDARMTVLGRGVAGAAGSTPTDTALVWTARPRLLSSVSWWVCARQETCRPATTCTGHRRTGQRRRR